MIAASLLIGNPLYRLHARRAMSDVPCEAFMLLGLYFALWAWRRTLENRGGMLASTGFLLAGLSAGLSILSKLSGMLSLLVVTSWVILTLLLGEPLRKKVEVAWIAVLSGGMAAALIVLLNPYLTAKPPRPFSGRLREIQQMNPIERAKVMLDLRLKVSGEQKVLFPHNALNTFAEKCTTVAGQGFGRFGPLGPSHSDSTRRFEASQDWGCLVWFPLVLVGGRWAWRKGRAQRLSGLAPTAWAVLLYFVVALAVVTVYIPMAWDRYLLPIQAPSALLAAGALVSGISRARAVLPGLLFMERA
ncbi:MAG: hypothetical protein NVSMB9_05830 [Isosphaeraceae bacterium]